MGTFFHGIVLLLALQGVTSSYCGYRSASGYQCEYDLSHLVRSHKPYQKLSSHGDLYYLNVCEPLVNIGCPSGSGVCLNNTHGTVTSLGTATNTTFSELNAVDYPMKCPGVRLVYSNGSQCEDTTQEITIEFHCERFLFGMAIWSVTPVSPCKSVMM